MKMEKHHYYVLVFIAGFTFGFISAVTSIPTLSSLNLNSVTNPYILGAIKSGALTGFSSAFFTVLAYEIGVKKGRG